MSQRTAVVLTSLLAGAIPGVFAFWLHLQELRWLVIMGVGLPIGVVWLLMERRTPVAWLALVLSTQVYVSVRFLHGRAGSEGLEFPLMFVLGAALAASEWVDRGQDRDFRIRWGGPMAIPILLIFATGLNSIVFSEERFVGVTGLFRIFQFYALYLVGLNFADSETRVRTTVHLLALVLLMQSAVFAFQAASGITFSLTGDVYDGRGVRAGGTVGANSAIYATFISPLLFVVATRVLSPLIPQRERLWLALPLVAGFLSMVFTLRRGAWGGVGLGLLWLGFTGLRRRAIAAWVPWASLAAAVAVGIVAPEIAELVDQYRDDNPMDEAFDERMNLMRIAMRVIEEHPLAGVGIAAYPHAFKHYVPPELYVGWVSTVHNYYLLVTAETGIPGGIAFVLFLLFALRLGWKASRETDPTLRLLSLALGGAVVSHAFAVAWEPLRDFAPNAMLWFLIGIVAGAQRGHAPSAALPKRVAAP